MTNNISQQNSSFMNKCGVCGADEECLSTIEMHANYGSRYDGEHSTLKLCAKCFDTLYTLLKHQVQMETTNQWGWENE